MSTGSNHRIVALRDPAGQHCSMRRYRHPEPDYGCLEQALFRCSWDYVTGRQGRVSYADRQYCENHARKFAERHGLVFPPR